MPPTSAVAGGVHGRASPADSGRASPTRQVRRRVHTPQQQLSPQQQLGRSNLTASISASNLQQSSTSSNALAAPSRSALYGLPRVSASTTSIPASGAGPSTSNSDAIAAASEGQFGRMTLTAPDNMLRRQQREKEREKERKAKKAAKKQTRARDAMNALASGAGVSSGLIVSSRNQAGPSAAPARSSSPTRLVPTRSASPTRSSSPTRPRSRARPASSSRVDDAAQAGANSDASASASASAGNRNANRNLHNGPPSSPSSRPRPRPVRTNSGPAATNSTTPATVNHPTAPTTSRAQPLPRTRPAARGRARAGPTGLAHRASLRRHNIYREIAHLGLPGVESASDSDTDVDGHARDGAAGADATHPQPDQAQEAAPAHYEDPPPPFPAGSTRPETPPRPPPQGENAQTEGWTQEDEARWAEYRRRVPDSPPPAFVSDEEPESEPEPERQTEETRPETSAGPSVGPSATADTAEPVQVPTVVVSGGDAPEAGSESDSDASAAGTAPPRRRSLEEERRAWEEDISRGVGFEERLQRLEMRRRRKEGLRNLAARQTEVAQREAEDWERRAMEESRAAAEAEASAQEEPLPTTVSDAPPEPAAPAALLNPTPVPVPAFAASTATPAPPSTGPSSRRAPRRSVPAAAASSRGAAAGRTVSAPRPAALPANTGLRTEGALSHPSLPRYLHGMPHAHARSVSDNRVSPAGNTSSGSPPQPSSALAREVERRSQRTHAHPPGGSGGGGSRPTPIRPRPSSESHSRFRDDASAAAERRRLAWGAAAPVVGLEVPRAPMWRTNSSPSSSDAGSTQLLPTSARSSDTLTMPGALPLPVTRRTPSSTSLGTSDDGARVSRPTSSAAGDESDSDSDSAEEWAAEAAAFEQMRKAAERSTTVVSSGSSDADTDADSDGDESRPAMWAERSPMGRLQAALPKAPPPLALGRSRGAGLAYDASDSEDSSLDGAGRESDSDDSLSPDEGDVIRHDNPRWASAFPSAGTTPSTSAGSTAGGAVHGATRVDKGKRPLRPGSAPGSSSPHVGSNRSSTALGGRSGESTSLPAPPPRRASNVSTGSSSRVHGAGEFESYSGSSASYSGEEGEHAPQRPANAAPVPTSGDRSSLQRKTSVSSIGGGGSIWQGRLPGAPSAPSASRSEVNDRLRGLFGAQIPGASPASASASETRRASRSSLEREREGIEPDKASSRAHIQRANSIRSARSAMGQRQPTLDDQELRRDALRDLAELQSRGGGGAVAEEQRRSIAALQRLLERPLPLPAAHSASVSAATPFLPPQPQPQAGSRTSLTRHGALNGRPSSGAPGRFAAPVPVAAPAPLDDTPTASSSADPQRTRTDGLRRTATGSFINPRSSFAPLPRQTRLPTITDATRHFPPTNPGVGAGAEESPGASADGRRPPPPPPPRAPVPGSRVSALLSRFEAPPEAGAVPHPPSPSRSPTHAHASHVPVFDRPPLPTPPTTTNPVFAPACPPPAAAATEGQAQRRPPPPIPPRPGSVAHAVVHAGAAPNRTESGAGNAASSSPGTSAVPSPWSGGTSAPTATAPRPPPHPGLFRTNSKQDRARRAALAALTRNGHNDDSHDGAALPSSSSVDTALARRPPPPLPPSSSSPSLAQERGLGREPQRVSMPAPAPLPPTQTREHGQDTRDPPTADLLGLGLDEVEAGLSAPGAGSTNPVAAPAPAQAAIPARDDPPSTANGHANAPIVGPRPASRRPLPAPPGVPQTSAPASISGGENVVSPPPSRAQPPPHREGEAEAARVVSAYEQVLGRRQSAGAGPVTASSLAATAAGTGTAAADTVLPAPATALTPELSPTHSEGRASAPAAPPDPNVNAAGLELTDLDLLAMRLEQSLAAAAARSSGASDGVGASSSGGPGPAPASAEGQGRDPAFEAIALLEDFLGPALPERHRLSPSELASIPAGRVEVERRRVTREGKVRSKLACLGLRVDRCGICLGQFKEGQRAFVLGCLHVFHAGGEAGERAGAGAGAGEGPVCAQEWFRRSRVCPTCRMEVDVDAEG